MLFSHLLGERSRNECVNQRKFYHQKPMAPRWKRYGWSGRYMDKGRPKNTPRKPSPNESTEPTKMDQYPRMHGISILVHGEVMLSNSCILQKGGWSSLTLHWKQLPDFNPIFPTLIISSDHELPAMPETERLFASFPKGLKSKKCQIAQKLLDMPSFTAPLLFSCAKPKQRRSKSVILFWRFLHIVFVKNKILKICKD